jgi:hypothetical protein
MMAALRDEESQRKGTVRIFYAIGQKKHIKGRVSFPARYPIVPYRVIFARIRGRLLRYFISFSRSWRANFWYVFDFTLVSTIYIYILL